MFELSFGKLLILVFVVALVWYGARGGSRPTRRESGPPPRPGDARRVEAEDMTPCPVCGTYVTTVRPNACERPDCPYR